METNETQPQANDMVGHLLSVGQVRRAQEIAQQQVAANPDDPSALGTLAQVLLYSGQPAAAATASESALSLAPEWAALWGVRSRAELTLGRFAASERSVLEAIRLEPDEAGSFLTYARLLAACGENRAALNAARHALELEPDDEDAHRIFATLLVAVSPRDWKISEAAALRAVSLDPENADSHAVLGRIRLDRGRAADAEESLRAALDLDPNNRLALEGLAVAVMSRAWWYRPFLWYGLTMSKLGPSIQLLVVIGLWTIVSAARLQVESKAGDEALTIGYFAICAYTWFADPITRFILRRRYPWL